MSSVLELEKSMVLKLRPYQDEAADFLYSKDRAMILAPVGAGKTAITLTAMQAMISDGHVKRFLVLAPKRVCTDVWRQEGLKWASDLFIEVAVGTAKNRMGAFKCKANVIITNYDNLLWLCRDRPDLLQGFDGIVFDELTRLKNPSGSRFKALFKVIDLFKIRWGLTGSFTSNGLEDVFGQCKVIDQTLLGRSKGAFLEKYFVLMNRDYGDWAARSDSLPKIMKEIKPATYLLEAGDYKDLMPPLHTVEVRCQMDMAHYNTMKKDLVVAFPNATAVAANSAVVTGKLQQMSSGFVYQTTRTPSKSPGKFDTYQQAIWFSSHKFDRLEELLAENQRDCTLIFYNYKEELAELKRRYPFAQTLDDEDVINRWNTGRVELLLAHPKSAGHGLNLQHHANKIVFLSLPWSLELYEQAIGRIHRSGQKREVWCYVMLTDKTIDERIYSALHDKRTLSDIAIEELR
jgi:SNF2 family DNA or RNA helicase